MLVRLTYYNLFSTNFLYQKYIDILETEFWLTVQDNYLKFSHDFSINRSFLDFKSFLRDYKREKEKERYTYCVFSRKSFDDKLFVFNCVDLIKDNQIFSSRYLVIEGLKR